MTMTTDSDVILHLEREQNDRLSRLDARISKIEDEMNMQSKAILIQLRELVNYQKQHEDTLETLSTIVKGSVFLKWIIIVFLGTISAIGLIHTTLDAVVKWWSK